MGCAYNAPNRSAADIGSESCLILRPPLGSPLRKSLLVLAVLWNQVLECFRVRQPVASLLVGGNEVPDLVNVGPSRLETGLFDESSIPHEKENTILFARC